MVNDTSTLNGALQELGELMADNLTTQGVASTYDEGLTTLANKILDIQGGGTTQTLTLTSDKPILSYRDGDTATLTATLTGGDVANKTVEFFNGATSLGTATTDNTGVATKTYASTGVGDVSLTASVGSLVSEISIEDCTRYDSATSDNTSNYSFNKVVWNNANLTQAFSHDSTESAYKINNANVIGSNGCYYQTVLAEHSNSQFEISMLTKSGTSGSVDIGFNLVNGTRGNAVYYRVTTGTRRFTKNTSNTSWSHTTSLDNGTVCTNIWIKHILTVDNLHFTYKVINPNTEAVLWEYSNTFDNTLAGGDIGIVTGWDKYTHYIKEIKVKPL